MSESIFFERFTEWKKAMVNCSALHKTPGLWFCKYTGKPCAFVECPRRLYEKEIKAENFVPMEARVKQLDSKITTLQRTMIETRRDIGKLKEWIAKVVKPEESVA